MPAQMEVLTRLFEQNRSETNAGPMERYLKGQFPFLGIKTPVRRALEKQFYMETAILKEPFSQEFVWQLWERTEREYQYAALDYLEKSLKKLQKGDLLFMEQLITAKSWWDTVDAIAPKAVGVIAQGFPEVVEDTIDEWANSDNMWLRRAAILFQLKYKSKTNEELLYRYIQQNAECREFFIQKAIGWALREYSKTNPASVKQFIAGTKLAPLSVREGGKYL